VNAGAAPAERQRDPPGADAEFEGAAVCGQVGEEAHHRIHGRGLE
jgi:hypothetical protein